MQRRLAAILAADLAGYSRMMQADEQATRRRVRDFDRDVIGPLVARHGGRIFKRMGDGWLAEFTSVVEAAACALAWQEAAPDGLAFRIGVHLGDVMVEDDDLFGDGVNLAARIQAAARPGAVCLSEDAWRHVRGKTEAAFAPLGPIRLKNIEDPVALYQSGGAPDNATDAAVPPPSGTWHVPRVLLVPFRQIGASAEAEALAAGLTETLGAALAHFEELHVIDPSSLAGEISASGARRAAQEAGAVYLLEGTVQIAAGRARIGVQFVASEDGRRVWSETVDGDAGDLFALQDEVTAIVASTLGEAFGAELAKSIAQKPEADLTPFELLTRGLEHLHRLNREDNLTARQIFDRVRAAVPDEMLPTLCYAWTYAIELSGGWPPSRPDALDHALGLVRDLVRRFERSAQVHRLMGRLVTFTGDFDQGLAHARRAYELNPHSADMMISLGVAHLRDGRVDEATALLERAMRVNAYAPAAFRSYLSLAYFMNGDYAQGLDALSSVEGAVFISRVCRIANLVGLGRMDEARAEVAAQLAETPGFTCKRAEEALTFRRAEDWERVAAALGSAGMPV